MTKTRLNDGSPNNPDELCSAGKLLESRLNASTKSLSRAAESLEASSAKILDSVTELTKFSIRDKEQIGTLRESMKCKGEKIKTIEGKAQDLEVDFATHLGEHKTERRLTVASGAGGAGGIVGLWEFVKYLVKTQG